MQRFSQSGKLLLKAFVIGLCCVLLLFMTVELAHSHSLGAPDAAHCQLCAIAHVATLVRPAGLGPWLLLMLGMVSLGRVRAGSRAVLVTALIRPPPARF